MKKKLLVIPAGPHAGMAFSLNCDTALVAALAAALAAPVAR